MIIVLKYSKFTVFDPNSNVSYYFSSSDSKKLMTYESQSDFEYCMTTDPGFIKVRRSHFRSQSPIYKRNI